MKKLLSLLLVGIIASASCVNVYAYDLSKTTTDSVLHVSDSVLENDNGIPVGSAEYICDDTGTLIPVSSIPSFKTQEDADKYMDSLVSAVSIQPEAEFEEPISALARSSQDKIVASKKISAATLRLRTSYTKNSNGTASKAKAYTTFTGVTVGLSWHQKSITCSLSKNKKTISASATGDVAMYLLVDGMVELGRRTHSISGKVAV